MDYLNSHKQRIKVGSSYSKWSEIKRGIPQSSTLGTSLFNEFINNLLFVKEKSDICNFADDKNIYSCGSNLKRVLENLKHNASKLLYWFKINSMEAILEKLSIHDAHQKILSTSKTFRKNLYN